ncbi:MAG: hypothetical protein OXR62_14550 [Ahrensia sp.]|nr:hypothetical protein [Ahrensia sp.]
MSDFTIGFAPLFPWPVIAAIVAAAGLLALYGLFRKLRGGWLRFAAWAALALALANPSVIREEREPLKTVVAVVTDFSDSQKLDGREEQSIATRDSLNALMQRFPQFELRQVPFRNASIGDKNDASTALFTAVKSALQDVPPDQIGGVVMITDGQVHDIPEAASQLGFNAPVHALITGAQEDRDRRIEILQAPRFGIVGQSHQIDYRVSDANIDEAGFVDVTVLIDGEVVSVEQIQPGEEAKFYFDVPHGGKTIIEFRAELAENELTDVNNSAFTVMDGIRENLRVLLVSGEPHAGERTWRNLLKSDASVDLVHFTILRPPEKQDGTPINQLSLIAFPTRELFIEKIDEFDLIIFDRYQRRGVLPVLYFDNIARYVSDGGAILVAAGPEHADISSIHRTPLASVLPLEPTGNVIEEPFRARVSDAGRRHPVTRDLDGLQPRGSNVPPDWSRWFRLIEGANPQGDIVMEGPGDAPLLVLNRTEEGRVAMLMSDHVWLWARGFEGGGPHTQLLRRLGHWLMKEPELDEEALRATAEGNRIIIERQTMGDAPGNVQMITPGGETITLGFSDEGDGRFVAQYEADALGLYRIANGDLTALTNVGPANPREYSQIISTTQAISPIATETGGLVTRIAKENPARSLPRIVPVRSSGTASGSGWMGFRTTESSVLKGITTLPLFAGILGLAALLMMLAGTWAREGR